MKEKVRKKILLIYRWLRIIFRKSSLVEQGKGKFYSVNSVKGYYNDFTQKLSVDYGYDKQGIPKVMISATEYVYFPIEIFIIGLANYDMYLGSNCKKNYNNFLTIADWAVKKQRENGSWNCFGPIRSARYTVSAMGQGLGVSLLLRAFIESNKIVYLESALKAADFMLLPFSKGGVAYETADILILEEYPEDPCRGVLNGWIYSIFGLYDIAIFTGEEKYKELLEKTIKSLKKFIKKYDSNYWSFYDLKGTIASPHYHKIHIILLEILNELTNEKIFLEFSTKWKKDKENKLFYCKAVVKKMLQKLKDDVDILTLK